MSNPMLTNQSALGAVARPGRYGNPSGAPGVVISERVGLGLATVIARKGQGAALASTVKGAYGVDLPDAARVVGGPAVAFVGTGAGKWFAVSETMHAGDLAIDLVARLKGLASISDQCDGRAVTRVSGARARDVLAKGLPIDLDPNVFSPGSAATSVTGYMGIQLWQVDDAPTYDLAVFRSIAESFWHWLMASAAEFGFQVRPGQDLQPPRRA